MGPVHGMQSQDMGRRPQMVDVLPLFGITWERALAYAIFCSTWLARGCPRKHQSICHSYCTHGRTGTSDTDSAREILVLEKGNIHLMPSAKAALEERIKEGWLIRESCLGSGTGIDPHQGFSHWPDGTGPAVMSRHTTSLIGHQYLSNQERLHEGQSTEPTHTCWRVGVMQVQDLRRGMSSPALAIPLCVVRGSICTGDFQIRNMDCDDTATLVT